MKNNFSQKIKNIYSDIDRGHLGVAMNDMQQLLSAAVPVGLDVAQYRSELESIRSTYGYMLQYAMQGMPDPSRSDMRRQLAGKLYLLCYRLSCMADRYSVKEHYMYDISRRSVEGLNLTQEINSYLNLIRRAGMSEDDEVIGSSMRRRADGVLTNIFMKVWTAYPLTHSMAEEIRPVICSNDTPRDLRMQLVSALTLLLSSTYDGRAVRVLLDAYVQNDDSQVSAAALVGAVIALLAHYKIALHDTDTQTLLHSLVGHKEFRTDVFEVINNLAATRETESINKAIHDEILPQIQRTRADLVSGLQEHMKSGEIEDIEANPMWQKLMEDTGLTDKLKKLSDWQMEGADVMMSAFGELKRGPFFKAIENWFIPFNPQRVPGYENRRDVLSRLLPLIEVDRYMCDSDKYSFLLAISQMPEMQRNMMSAQMSEQLEQMLEEQKSSLTESLTSEIHRQITRTVRSLFRFFRQYDRRIEFRDPFALQFVLPALQVIPGMSNNEKLKTTLAEFFMTRGFYADAALLYRSIVDDVDDGRKEMLLQKLGYCYQKIREYNRALKAYSRAEMINGDSKWLLRQMALCYKRIGDYDSAIKYYEMLAMQEPENVKVLLNLANCLLETERYDEALKLYFKIDYLNPNNINSLRPMAWCLLLMNRNDESRAKYDEILAQTPTAPDLLAYGHMLLKHGEVANAVKAYRHAVNLWQGDYSRFVENFENDTPLLLKLGVEQEMAALVPDMVFSADGGEIQPR